MSLWLLAAPPATAPLPRLVDHSSWPANTQAPTWPPVPEEASAQSPQVPPEHSRSAVGYTTSDEEAERGPKISSRAPSSDDEDDDDDAGGIDWQIGFRRKSHKNSDLTLSFGIWPASIAGGIWWGLPILKRGLIPSINDAFLLEFGALFIGSQLWNSSGANQFDILPALGVRWDFYLTKLVTVFGTVKLGPRIGVAASHRVFPDPVLAAGCVLNLTRRAGLRMELSYPQGFVFGLLLPIGPLPQGS